MFYGNLKLFILLEYPRSSTESEALKPITGKFSYLNYIL
jgi:hypothetical protein